MRIWNLYPMSPDPAPGGGGGPPASAPDPAPPAPAPDPEPPAPGVITLTSEQLNDRLGRSRTSFLRAHGFQSDDELKAMVQRDKDRTKKEDEERRAALSREQVLQEDLAREKAAREASDRERTQLAFEGRVSGVCARLGVRNVEYAQFEIGRASQALPAGQAIDPEQWLKEQMESRPALKVALGIEGPVAPVPAPVNTMPGAPPPPAPPAPGGPPADPDAMTMTPEAWRARKEALGLS